MSRLKDILFQNQRVAPLVIDKIAKDLETNQAMVLVTLHGARSLSKLKAKTGKGPERGLTLAADELIAWIEDMKNELKFAELEETKHFAQYDAFRRIIQRERATTFHPDKEQHI